MDILKRKIAPISQAAWDEIDQRAEEVLRAMLSARKVLKVNGPKGWDYPAVPEGRLDILEEKEELSTGTYRLQKLVEVRRRFTLNRWELDNIERGAKDIDLGPLEEAAEDIALFEEELIYNGYQKGEVEGLSAAAAHQMSFGKTADAILKSIGEAKYALYNSYVLPPYDLVVSPEAYERLNKNYDGMNLFEEVEKIIEGEIIRSKVVKGAIMVPHKDDDLEFTVGQDFSVGYENEDNKTVTLFITESLTLRVLDEGKIVNFKL